MCIGVPLQVVEGDEQTAVCVDDGRRERLNMLLVGRQPPGTWVLAFQGSALRVMDEDEAQQTRAALAALDAALQGHDVDAFFADLLNREPTLPPHLGRTAKEIDP
ncbi:MAG TPA: HypC/HybG/HupF family hydrogenase formation chaperone [Burkholderiaceae bacterium]|nr:HypC/HybG/HupF family hydrogenase formation chaperone [Burkholderiaceae bacterium]